MQKLVDWSLAFPQYTAFIKCVGVFALKKVTDLLHSIMKLMYVMKIKCNSYLTFDKTYVIKYYCKDLFWFPFKVTYISTSRFKLQVFIQPFQLQNRCLGK